MKSIRNHLRILMAAGSLAGFLAGWILLAHSPKAVASAPVPAAELNLPTPDFSAPTGLQPLPAMPQAPGFSMPLLRTHGS